MTRASRLIYQGTCEEGNIRCGDFFDGVPARDLDAADIAVLSDAQYAQITGSHPTLGPLYVDPDARQEPGAVRLDARTMDELRQLAAEREIEGRSGMNKTELVAALRAAGEQG